MRSRVRVRRVALAWELGAGLGHIDRLHLVATALHERGFEPVLLLRDLHHAHQRLGAAPASFIQAPLRWPRPAHVPFLGNYSSVLAAAGWLDAGGLAGQVQAWQTTLQLLDAQMLVADHAPTAQLAASLLGLPVCMVGNSFQVPPPGDPFPPMRHWVEGESDRCAGFDAVVLPVVNAALGMLGKSGLHRLTQVHDGATRAVLSLPEFAHYSGYGDGAHFVGPSFVSAQGAEPVWPKASGVRVFAYLDARYPAIDNLAIALRRLGCTTLVYARGMDEARGKALASTDLSVCYHPIRVADALASTDLVITHASIGTATAAALAGKPQLALPMQTEQWMVGRRIEEAGVGLCVVPPAGVAEFMLALSRLIHQPSIRSASAALARRHTGLAPELTGRRVAALIEQALA